MFPQPPLDVWAGGDHPEILLLCEGQSGSHQGVADALALGRAGHLGMLEVEDVVGEIAVEQLRLSIGKGSKETAALGIVLDDQQELLKVFT